MRGRVKIEECPSNRSHCCKCGSAIKQGVNRVLECYGNGRFRREDKYCAPCSLNLIQSYIDEMSGYLQILNDEIAAEEGAHDL
jgi:PHP family Zn ribbon phosphoesterase